MNRALTCLVSGLLLAGAFAASASAATAPRYGAFIYSDLCTQYQSGDVGGLRLALLRLAKDDTLVVWRTEGAVMASVVAQDLKVSAGGFTASLPSEGVDLKARFTGDGLSVTVGTEPARHLRRLLRPSDPPPACR